MGARFTTICYRRVLVLDGHFRPPFFLVFLQKERKVESQCRESLMMILDAQSCHRGCCCCCCDNSGGLPRNQVKCSYPPASSSSSSHSNRSSVGTLFNHSPPAGPSTATADNGRRRPSVTCRQRHPAVLFKNLFNPTTAESSRPELSSKETKRNKKRTGGEKSNVHLV